MSLFIVSLRGGVKKDQAINVEIAGLYWHFVDIVWIVIFTLRLPDSVQGGEGPRRHWGLYPPGAADRTRVTFSDRLDG